MNLIEVRNLVKTFENEAVTTTVLKGISFDMAEGEFVAIMGQSGSGKFTLLYNISGMDQMTSGHVTIDKVDLAGKTDEELAELRLTMMGFVFQNNYLLKNLYLYDNICLPGFKAKKDSVQEVEDRASQLMERLGIGDVKNSPIQQVSGGQLQRAAICRALINKPRILFADEPTGSLNSRNAEEVMRIFNQLNREGMSILTVTHDPKVASVTHRIIYLKDGQIEAELELGKFDEGDDLRQREEKTMNWLIERGF